MSNERVLKLVDTIKFMSKERQSEFANDQYMSLSEFLQWLETDLVTYVPIVDYEYDTKLNHVIDAEPVLKLLREMGEALELSVDYQEKAKNFISHYDDCNALIYEESEGPCECGMEEYTHNNDISQSMAKGQIKKLNTFLASIDKGNDELCCYRSAKS